MLTKSSVQKIHQEINTAMKLIAEKNGLIYSDRSKIVYDSQSFKFTAQFGDSDSSPAGTDPKYLTNMHKHGWKFGLSEKDIGSTFHVASLGQCTLMGMSGTIKAAIKAPTGKSYIMRAAQVAQLLGKKQAQTIADVLKLHA